MLQSVSKRADRREVLFAAPGITEGDVEAVVSALRSGWITTGTECEKLEAELSAYLDVPHVVSVSSCTAALEIALAFLDLPPGARVGVPTWTFASSALAAVHNGARPVLLDVDPETLNLSQAALERAIDERRLDAVVGVHFAGVPLPQQVHELCHARGIPLVEDAAHALGATDHRGSVAGQGTAGACYSFYATKNLTSAEGGALATDDTDLAAFARSYRLHGLSKDAWARYLPGGRAGYDVVEPGIKANLPDVLAALARSQLRRFDELQRQRRVLVERYRSNLTEVAGLRLVPGELDPRSADHLMVVILPEGSDRAMIADRMQAAGVGTSVHFQPLHTFTWFEKHAEVGAGGTPVADATMHRALSLPLHSQIEPADVDRVCEALACALA